MNFLKIWIKIISTNGFHLNFCKIHKINSYAKISPNNAGEPQENFHKGRKRDPEKFL